MPGHPMQRTHQRETPLTPAEVEAARAGEADRKKWDPDYVTAAEARDMAPEVSALPQVAARIARSQPDWPENRMSATEALGDLPTGGGEQYARKDQVPADSLFTGEVSGGAAAAGTGKE